MPEENNKIKNNEKKENNSGIVEENNIIIDSKKKEETLVENVKIKVDTDALKNEVETIRYWNNRLLTFEILDWTWLKEKMLKVLEDTTFDSNPEFKNLLPEQRLEKIFRKINIVLTKFYERKFNIEWKEEIPEHITNVLIPATEWFLMDTLKETWHKENVNFLSEMINIKADSIKTLYDWIKKFSDNKNFELPYNRWKALLNIIDFVSLPKNQEKTKQLKNPYEVYKNLFNNPIFNNTFTTIWKNKEGIVNINNISRNQFELTDINNTLSQEELDKKLEEWKNEMKSYLWSIEMVESPETINNILWILDKADWFMSSTKKLWDELIDKVDTFWNLNKKINSSFWFDAWWILKNLEKQPIIWKILTFVLSILGFSGWIWWIEKAWKKRNIDRNLDSTKKEYINEVYKTYMENKTIDSWTSKKILNKYWISIDSKYEDKFAIDIDLIKQEINKKIWENWELINPLTLYSINSKSFKGKELVEEVKEWKDKVLKIKRELTETERQDFIEWYIQTILNQYKKKKRIENLKDADTLAFSMIAWITLDKDDVIDGIEAEVFLPSQFYEKIEWNWWTDNDENIDERVEEKADNLNYWVDLNENQKNIIKWELESVKSPITTDNIIQSSINYNIPVEYIMAIIKNDSTYWTLWKWKETINPWNVGNMDDNSTREFWSWQEWVDAATKVIRHRIVEYQKVYGKDDYPWIKNLVENRWPDWKWFISNQKNYKQTNDYRENWNKAPYWAYMTDKNWPEDVSIITKSLRDKLNQA